MPHLSSACNIFDAETHAAHKRRRLSLITLFPGGDE